MNPADFGLSLKEVIGAVFMFAFVWYELKAIRRDINRLEKKQDKYNNLQERTHHLEIWRKYHEKEHIRGDK